MQSLMSADHVVCSKAASSLRHLLEEHEWHPLPMLCLVFFRVLQAAMGARFVKTKKVMPAGVVAGAGLLGLLFHGKRIGDWA